MARADLPVTRLQLVQRNARDMSEVQLENHVMGLALYMGYRRHHQRPGRNKRGTYASQIKGEVGWPDLVLSHPAGVTLFRELKKQGAQPTPEQVLWLESLSASGLDAGLWRPIDWYTYRVHRELAITGFHIVDGAHVTVLRQPSRAVATLAE